MNNIIKRIDSQETRDLTYAYSKNQDMGEDTFIFYMVYDFAKNLPYSMDIQQEEYVSADFFNMTPYDFANDKFFKWEDSRTIYKAMISSGDTFKSGVILQMCAIFQKMLSGHFPNDYVLREEDFYSLGIDQMTPQKEYNRNFFDTLKSLPEYYEKVQNAKSKEERREILDAIYREMQKGIANRIGGYKEIDADGNVTTESKPSIMWKPVLDLRMLYESRYVEYSSRGISELKEMIRKQDLKKLETSKKRAETELESKER